MDEDDIVTEVLSEPPPSLAELERAAARRLARMDARRRQLDRLIARDISDYARAHHLRAIGRFTKE